MPQARQIITSSRAADRIAVARDWLDAASGVPEILIVAPVRAAADDLVRSVARARGALSGVHRLTLNRLCGLLAAERMAARGLAIASDLAEQALAARAVFHLASQSAIVHFAPIIDRPGFAHALARSIRELRANDVSIDALRALGAAGAELAAMLTRYEAELTAANLIDRAGLLAIASEAIADTPAPHLAGIPVLMLDVAPASRRDSALIAALAARAPQILATIPAGDERGERMMRDALGVDAAPCASGAAPDSSLARLQNHLFATTAPEPRDLDGTVAVTSAPGEMHECVEIARRIHQEARRGVRFDRIAVLIHDTARYLPHIQEALARAEIPAHFERGARRPRPGGRAMLALLACAAENLSARRYAEYLSIAQVPGGDDARDRETRYPGGDLVASPLARDLDSPPDDGAIEMGDAGEDIARAPSRWERLIVEAAVIGSADRWYRRLDGYGNELRRRRDELADDDARCAGLDREIADLRHLREIALPHIELLAALPKAATWGDWVIHLTRIAEAAVRDRDALLETLGEFAPMAPVGPVTLDEVRRVLAERLARLEDSPKPRRYGEVFVAPTHRARGMSFEVVIVPGLAERVFPQKVTEDPILPDAAREVLDAAALERNEDRVAAERLALRIAAGASEGRVIFSYPRIDIDQGRPRVPSFYALEVLRAAEGRLPGFDELARRAACEQATRLGWPAPSRPDVAIDDAEFDLAVLDKLLDSEPETTRGAAHYLLGVNDYLGRALRSRARRWLRRWTTADGLVDPPPSAMAALGRHQLSARSYSPTALQNYASCPYRFFLQAIHRLEPREEIEALEVIDPLTRGGLFHEVQYEALTALRATEMLPVAPDILDRAFAILDATLDSVASRWREELAPAIERVWQDGIEEIRADLREWMRRAAADAERWRPDRFELSFGLADRSQSDPASSPDPVALESGLNLRGSIDLVERAGDGRLRVTDHKTGRVRAESDFVIGGGKILQPVLYALAAERLIGEPVGTGRLYYCTAAGGYEERVVTIDDAARAAERELARTLGDALGAGFLPAAPAERECEWCDYRRVCGPYEEIRLNHKLGRTRDGLSARGTNDVARRLAPLEKLRGMR